MTPIQQTCLDIIRRYAASPEFVGFGWTPASAMAWCQVESLFRPAVSRYEPRLGESSWGVMQVLESTARDLGFTGPIEDLYDPETGILYGMRYARRGWNYLASRLGQEPTLAEWAAGYNEGYGAAARGEPDPAYVEHWLWARGYWLAHGAAQ